jgi:hypothetical protein
MSTTMSSGEKRLTTLLLGRAPVLRANKFSTASTCAVRHRTSCSRLRARLRAARSAFGMM